MSEDIRFPCRAWILIEVDRWQDGLPCTTVLFSEECPSVPGCWAVGVVEVSGGGLQKSLRPPALTPLQRRVWEAVVGWTEDELMARAEAG